LSPAFQFFFKTRGGFYELVELRQKFASKYLADLLEIRLDLGVIAQVLDIGRMDQRAGSIAP
jgi:hypothetical protein